MALIDEPIETWGETPLCGEGGIRHNLPMNRGEVLATWAKDGRAGMTLRFPSAYHAAGWYETTHADVWEIVPDEPVRLFHVPVTVRVTLLDLSRESWPAHHRARCAGCCLCA